MMGTRDAACKPVRHTETMRLQSDHTGDRPVISAGVDSIPKKFTGTTLAVLLLSRNGLMEDGVRNAVGFFARFGNASQPK
jgi:hypothetical protein